MTPSQHPTGDESRSLPVLRALIDAVDHEVLQLLSRRNGLVTEIAAYKRAHGVAIRDHRRPSHPEYREPDCHKGRKEPDAEQKKAENAPAFTDPPHHQHEDEGQEPGGDGNPGPPPHARANSPASRPAAIWPAAGSWRPGEKVTEKVPSSVSGVAGSWHAGQHSPPSVRASQLPTSAYAVSSRTRPSILTSVTAATG